MVAGIHSGREVRRRLVSAAAGLLLITGGLAPVSPVLAAGDTIRIDPATSMLSVGDTVTLTIVGNTSAAAAGSQASVVFDPSELQVVSIAKGADWVEAAAAYAGYPNPTRMASFLADANASGKLPAIAAYFTDGSSLEAGDHALLTVTFEATSCGDSTVDLPIGPTDGAMIDGEPGTYGDDLSILSVPGSVSVACAPGASPRPSGAGTRRSANTSTSESCSLGMTVEGEMSSIDDLPSRGYFDSSSPWFGTSVAQVYDDSDLALGHLANGIHEVAAVSSPLSPGQAENSFYSWSIGLDHLVLPRRMTTSPGTDDSRLVRAEDYVNYMLIAAGRATASSLPILDYDVNLDGAIGLADLGNISGRWRQTSACNGWIRADVNNDGAIGLADIGRVTAHWGQVGFVAPATPQLRITDAELDFEGTWEEVAQVTDQGEPTNTASVYMTVTVYDPTTVRLRVWSESEGQWVVSTQMYCTAGTYSWASNSFSTQGSPESLKAEADYWTGSTWAVGDVTQGQTPLGHVNDVYRGTPRAVGRWYPNQYSDVTLSPDGAYTRAKQYFWWWDNSGYGQTNGTTHLNRFKSWANRSDSWLWTIEFRRYAARPSWPLPEDNEGDKDGWDFAQVCWSGQFGYYICGYNSWASNVPGLGIGDTEEMQTGENENEEAQFQVDNEQVANLHVISGQDPHADRSVAYYVWLDFARNGMANGQPVYVMSGMQLQHFGIDGDDYFFYLDTTGSHF